MAWIRLVRAFSSLSGLPSADIQLKAAMMIHSMNQIPPRMVRKAKMVLI